MRNVHKFKWLNDGLRTLNESIIYPEVEQALKDWKNNCKADSVLIGGLAYSYYCKPRSTQDVDLLFLSFDEIPSNVEGFKRTRDHAFLHKDTHVEVEVLDPEFLKLDKRLVQLIFDEAWTNDKIKIASPKGIICLKLNRYSLKDQSDIDDLLKYCVRLNINLDFDKYNLNNHQLDNLNKSLNNLNLQESEDVNSFVLESNLLLNKSKYTEIENSTGYRIIVFEDKNSDPCFYYFNKINRIMRFDDFVFCIKIPNRINEKLEVIESSSDFKSLIGYEKEKSLLLEWLTKENAKRLKNSWTILNS